MRELSERVERMSARPNTQAPVRVLLIDHHDSFTHNLAQQIWASGAACEVRAHDQLSEAELSAGYTHFVLSPGPGDPQRPEDFQIGRTLLHHLTHTPFAQPLLGVCLGHQAIAMSLGAEVGRAPHVMHGKESLVRHLGSGLFEGLPSPMSVMRYHSLCVAPHTLPPCLTPIAWSEEDEVLMGFEHRDLPVFGVQFHPESIATPLGGALMERFLKTPPCLEHPYL